MDPYDVIANAILKAASLNLTKPYDVAVTIDAALDVAGYRITRKPARKEAK